MQSGRRLAVLIGINEYKNGIPPLRNAIRDIEAVAGVLREHHGYQVQTLADEQAGRHALIELLDRLPRELAPDDRLILYFAGHGIAEESAAHEAEASSGPMGFLIPHDACGDDPGTFLSMQELQQRLERLTCRHLLLFLDCCFAGAFRWSAGTRSLGKRRVTIYQERYERYLRDSAWQVITSAAHDERALDVVAGRVLGERGEVGQNSPFAAALCLGLGPGAQADLTQDQVIVATELHLHLEREFERLEVKLGRRQQKPMLWSIPGKEKGEFVFPLPYDRTPRLQSALELSEKNNPYRGLSTYEASDKELFFGRQRTTEELRARVMNQVLTVVVGASGTGKSSLVRAGLIPLLEQQSEPPFRILVPQRPGNAPLEALAELVTQLGQPKESRIAEAVVAFCAEQPQRHLLLVIDQLEELVTQTQDAVERATFRSELAEVMSQGGSRVHIVLTLRLDFETHFLDLMTESAENKPRFLIPHMSREELRQVVERPAIERVMFFEPPELVDRLVDEVIDAPGALPLLSFTLAEMYAINQYNDPPTEVVHVR